MTKSFLSTDTILRAALRLVDAEGLEALTMRRLAEDLGVATMSLYGHVRDKDELLVGVVNLAAREMELPRPGTSPWDALRVITAEFRRVALLHPRLVPVIVRQPPSGSEGMRILDASLDALRRAGMEPAMAARAYRLMASFAIGFVSLECGGFFRPVDATAAHDALLGEVGALPRIEEMAPHLEDWDADEEFELGMDLIIGALGRSAGLT